MNTFKIIITIALLVLPLASSNRGPAGVHLERENPEGFDRNNLNGDNGQHSRGINFGRPGGPRIHAEGNGQGGKIDVEGGRGLGGVHAEAGRGHGRVNVEGPGGLGRVNVEGGNGRGRVNVQAPGGFGRVNVEGGNGRGRIGIQGPGGLGFGLDSERGFSFGSGASNDEENEDRERLARAGKVIGGFFRGLRHFSSEVRDKLHEQGLSDEEISETLYNFGAQLRLARANGASAEELYRQIQYFTTANNLEEIERKYVALVKQGARSAGLGDFESKIEGFIRSNGGVGNAISRAESNFNAAGGIDGIVARITSIAEQGGPAAVVAQIRSVLSQWGLEGAFKNLTSLYRAALRLTPLGNFVRLASLSRSLSGLNPLGIVGSFLGNANGGFALGSGIPGLNIAGSIANAIPGFGGSGLGDGNAGLNIGGGLDFANGIGAGVGGRRSGVLGNTFGAGLEAIVRTPLEITERILQPFGIIPGINIARGVVSTTGSILG